MGARARVVRLGGRSRPSALPACSQRPYLLRRAHGHLGEALDEHAAVRILAQSERGATDGREQIGEALAIELQEGDAQQEAPVLQRTSALNGGEEMLSRTGDHARARRRRPLGCICVAA